VIGVAVREQDRVDGAGGPRRDTGVEHELQLGIASEVYTPPTETARTVYGPAVTVVSMGAV